VGKDRLSDNKMHKEGYPGADHEAQQDLVKAVNSIVEPRKAYQDDQEDVHCASKDDEHFVSGFIVLSF